MPDIRRGAASVAPTQTAIKPVTSPSALGAVDSLTKQAVGIYANYQAGQASAADDRNAADFQIGLIDTSLGESSTMRKARTSGAKLDAAEEQSVNPNVIRNRRIRDLRTYIDQDPSNREEYSKIFKATVGDIGDELEEEEDFNVQAAIDAETSRYNEARQKTIVDYGFGNESAEVQEVAINQVTQDIGSIGAFSTELETAKRFGKPYTDTQIMQKAGSTIRGVDHLIVSGINSRMAEIGDAINTTEGRLLAQNEVAQMRMRAIAKMKEDTGGVLSTEQIKELYYGPLSHYDILEKELSKDGDTRLKLLTNQNMLEKELTTAIRFDTQEKRIRKSLLDDLSKISEAGLLGRLYSDAELAQEMKNIIKGSVNLYGTQSSSLFSVPSQGGTVPTNSGGLTAPTDGSGQSRPGYVNFASYTPEKSNDLARVISSYIDNATERSLEAPTDEPGKTVQDIKDAKKIAEKTSDALAGPLVLDGDSYSPVNAQSYLKTIKNPNSIKISPTHREQATINAVGALVNGIAVDLGNKAASGNIRGVQGLSLRDIESKVMLQTDPQTGVVSFVNVPGSADDKSTFIGADTFGPSLAISRRAVDVAAALNFHYKESLTDMSLAYAHGVQGNTEYGDSLAYVSSTLQSAGGPKFLTSDQYVEQQKASEDFKGKQLSTGERIEDFVEDGVDRFQQVFLNPGSLFTDGVTSIKDLINTGATKNKSNSVSGKVDRFDLDQVYQEARDLQDSGKSLESLELLLSKGIITQEQVNKTPGLRALQEEGHK